jgi:peptidoglycan-N-acetylglucosamine deacetylase
MKIFIFKGKNIIRFFIAVTVVFAAILALKDTTVNVISVFSNEQYLPIYSVERADKKISITFDCAWGSEDIPDILNTLKSEDVKATFFLVGQWAEKFPDMVRQISGQGHDVGNHSYSHLRMGVMDNKKIKEEILTCGTILNKITGKKIDLFRAPYGDYNDNIIKDAKESGYYTIQWDVDSLDWKPDLSKDEIVSRVLKNVKPGSIILFHNDTQYTANILPSIIKTLKDAGYTFEPVSKMILRSNYTIDFEGRQRSKN